MPQELHFPYLTEILWWVKAVANNIGLLQIRGDGISTLYEENGAPSTSSLVAGVSIVSPLKKLTNKTTILAYEDLC